MTIRRERADFYSIPSLYDILHAPGTAGEVDVLERLARRYMDRGRRGRGDPERAVRDRWTWLEPACGTGRYLRVLAGRGHRVMGFDLSEAMVRYARARVESSTRSAQRRAGEGGRASRRGARLFVADMTSFTGQLRGERADIAFNLINTIRHLPNDRAMLAHLAGVAGSLRPGGVYLVGIGVCLYGLESPSEDTWEGQRGRCLVQQVAHYDPPGAGERAERVYSHLVVTRPDPRALQHIDSVYTLRTYSLSQWTRLIGRSAMRLEAVVDEAGQEIEPPEMGYGVWILRRRE